MKTLWFITSNQGKFQEASRKLADIQIQVVQKNLGYPELQANSLEDVARFGVDFLQEKVDQAFFLEDAGLFIESLQEFPGVYSSYVYHTIGLQGILDLMKEKPKTERKACFRSVIAYREPGQSPRFFCGECLGWITSAKRGSHGFGYDPIFIPQGEMRTFAEMQTEEKNQYSHRGRSLSQLCSFLQESK
jgi:XTP/dITP diphosphohydrolase